MDTQHLDNIALAKRLTAKAVDIVAEELIAVSGKVEGAVAAAHLRLAVSLVGPAR